MNHDVPRDERAFSDEDFFNALDLGRRGLATVRRRVAAGDTAGARAALVEYFRTRRCARWYFDLRDGRRGAAPSTWEGHDPKAIEHADHALENRFHLAADLVADFGPKLKWRTKETRGLGGNSVHFKWNKFLRDLGIAYARTGRTKYATKFAELAGRWLDDWPLVVDPGFGRTTKLFCTSDGHKPMPTAFRIISWLDALHSGVLFAPQTPVDTAFRFIKSMWFTARQYRRFEGEPYRSGNHHIWEYGAAPLIFGIMFPEFPETAKLVEQGRPVLREHADKSFLADGSYEERSTAYTWVALRMLLMAIELARLNRAPLMDREQRNRVKRGCEAFAGTVLPDGSQPDVGDQRCPVSRTAKMLGRTARLFRSRTAATVARKLRLTRLVDVEDRACLAGLDAGSLPLTACYPDSGYLVSRDGWSPRASAMSFNVPSGGKHHHTHDDPLSLQLVVRGQPMVGTPMTELYSVLNTDRYKAGAARSHFYEMSSHNVVLVNGKPARPLTAFMSFGLDPIPVESGWTEVPGGIDAWGRHRGYAGVCVERKIAVEHKKIWAVVDTVKGAAEGPHIARWHFEYGVEVSSDGPAFMARADKACLRIELVSDGPLRPRLRRDNRWLRNNPLRPGQPVPWVLDVAFHACLGTIFEIV